MDLWHMSKLEPKRKWLYISLLLSLIGIYIVHMFTPYLNHPIGWGTIAIIVALIPFAKLELEHATEKKKVQVEPKRTISVTTQNK
jgi:uncharacterized membrane protein YjfL (UPF0719 family)